MGGICPFCRTTNPSSVGSKLALTQKRADAKDPVAIGFIAFGYYARDHGLPQDVPRAVKLWTEAADLGDLDAHYRLGYLYHCTSGEQTEEDKEKGLRHLQHAAIQGHPHSRCALGVHECISGNYTLAVQHCMISAKVGDVNSLDVIKDMFMKGHATKAQYAEALKGYRDASEETKSPQREVAKAFYSTFKYLG
ncbi:hypothetical protein THAOC_03352 [Thalassiosira oceanica]|uniref:Uncharacterized protein n=1 Tax=Thalassiosira oceanica TaxID=159749 RepID=K0TCM4_THAOC|nr:hypothetical protein THAOC_03352 [Thalassiosira oceanica]|eukprot:EJK74944.1 hypothetical protein THAOC_03352 [Thalassiosira oceanica]